jgi:hypothetical protein
MAPVGITSNCKRFTVEVAPPGRALPPAQRQAGPTGEAGQRRRCCGGLAGARGGGTDSSKSPEPVAAFVDDTGWFCQVGPQRCCEILA